MTDITKTVAPKTDQLNADDLLGGKTKTIKITGVREYQSADQPIGISYEGDNGKPWKPCLGMRRALIEIWGEDAAKSADVNYKGRILTLYRDPNVKFGNTVMGGIRVSHASNLKSEIKIALTVAKARRVEFVVKPLVVSKTETPTQEAPKTQETPANPELEKKAKMVVNAIKAEETLEGIEQIFDVDFKGEMDFIKKENAKTFQFIVDLGEAKREEIRVKLGVSMMGG